MARAIGPYLELDNGELWDEKAHLSVITYPILQSGPTRTFGPRVTWIPLVIIRIRIMTPPVSSFRQSTDRQFLLLPRLDSIISISEFPLSKPSPVIDSFRKIALTSENGDFVPFHRHRKNNLPPPPTSVSVPLFIR